MGGGYGVLSRSFQRLAARVVELAERRGVQRVEARGLYGGSRRALAATGKKECVADTCDRSEGTGRNGGELGVGEGADSWERWQRGSGVHCRSWS